MGTSMTRPFSSKTSQYLVLLDVCFTGTFFTLSCEFSRFFMEKQVMGEFVRILKVSRTVSVSLQLLQTISIMIQNLKNEHAICKLFLKKDTNKFAVALAAPVGYNHFDGFGGVTN